MKLIVDQLSMLPKTITVYGLNYVLGGVTVFSSKRSHYYAYVYNKDSSSFYLYDGLSKALKEDKFGNIKDEPSLLIYFLNNVQTGKNKDVENVKDGIGEQKFKKVGNISITETDRNDKKCEDDTIGGNVKINEIKRSRIEVSPSSDNLSTSETGKNLLYKLPSMRRFLLNQNRIYEY